MRYSIVLLAVLSFGFAHEAQARRVVLFWSAGGEKISLVEEMPDTEKWEVNGESMDLYVIHKQLSIFWIPLWNWEPRYVMSNEGMDGYYEFSEPAELAEIEAEHGDAASAIPFWDRIGGKLIPGSIVIIPAAVITLVLIGGILSLIFGRGGKKEEATEEPTEE